ncbi:hypothetical protein OFEAOIEE_LOCUS8 [Methylorubrum extorquens]
MLVSPMTVIAVIALVSCDWLVVRRVSGWISQPAFGP